MGIKSNGSASTMPTFNADMMNQSSHSSADIEVIMERGYAKSRACRAEAERVENIAASATSIVNSCQETLARIDRCFAEYGHNFSKIVTEKKIRSRSSSRAASQNRRARK